MAELNTKPVVLGRVSGLFGVKGWVKVHSYTDPREALIDYPGWRIEIDGRWEPAAVEEARPHGKTLIVKFDGVEDRDAAARYVEARIGVEREALPEPGDNEYYWTDLVGLTVERGDGSVLGTVDYLIETGANDVLVVRDGERETLVPFVVGEVVRNVDLRARVIRVDWEWE